MEVAVLLQPVVGNGYRAMVGAPFQLSVDGATREEALEQMRGLLEQRAREGVEVVTLRIPRSHPVQSAKPVWPQDELTQAWLAGIEEYRNERDREPDPWDQPAESGS